MLFLVKASPVGGDLLSLLVLHTRLKKGTSWIQVAHSTTAHVIPALIFFFSLACFLAPTQSVQVTGVWTFYCLLLFVSLTIAYCFFVSLTTSYLPHVFGDWMHRCEDESSILFTVWCWVSSINATNCPTPGLALFSMCIAIGRSCFHVQSSFSSSGAVQDCCCNNNSKGEKKLLSCSGAVLSSAKWQIKETMWHCVGAANRRGPPLPYAQLRSLYTVARVLFNGSKCTPLEQHPPEYFYKTISLFLT